MKSDRCRKAHPRAYPALSTCGSVILRSQDQSIQRATVETSRRTCGASRADLQRQRHAI
jgi:hypothetical protein